MFILIFPKGSEEGFPFLRQRVLNTTRGLPLLLYEIEQYFSCKYYFKQE